MQHAANAYQRTAQSALTPRDLEATVLIKAATKLQAIIDDWEGLKGGLDEALAFNRKLWTILVTSVTHAENPLPLAVKQNVVELGMFTFTRTLSCQAEPESGKLAALVNINRELAAGLRAPVAASQAA